VCVCVCVFVFVFVLVWIQKEQWFVQVARKPVESYEDGEHGDDDSHDSHSGGGGHGRHSHDQFVATLLDIATGINFLVAIKTRQYISHNIFVRLCPVI